MDRWRQRAKNLVGCILICSLLVSAAQGQITGPVAVPLGELVVLTSESAGCKQWEASQPTDLRWIATADGGIAFAAGCQARTVVIRCYTIDWEARAFRVDRHVIQVGQAPQPQPDPAPQPLSPISQIAYDTFAGASAMLRGSLSAVARNFADISSRGAALADWDGNRIMREINQANSGLLRQAEVWHEADPLYQQMIARVVQTGVSIDDKQAVVDACQEIAKGLRALQ